MIDDQNSRDNGDEQNPPAVWPPPPSGVDDFPQPPIGFRPMNLLALFGALVITCNLYHFVWIYRQLKIIQEYEKQHPSIFIAFWCNLVMYVMYLGILIAKPDANTNAPGLTALRWFDTLALLFLLFTIRHGINKVFRARSGTPQHANRIGTFFLSGLYLQYKINQNLKLQG